MSVARRQGRHLVLVGPTASGKSAVALALAERRRARGDLVELVSMDSMAVYRGMDIGTTTPGPADRERVPHHLVDLVDPDHDFSVAEFVAAVCVALDDIEERGGRAILVGGTGLYVQAIVDGLELPGRYPEVLARLEGEPDTRALHDRLTRADPMAADRIEPDNRRRVLRALEVTEGSGRPFSSYGPGLDAYPGTPFVLAGLRVARDVLGERIAVRVREQLDEGFLDEVRALVARPGGSSRTAAQALGYGELAAHLRGECSLDDAVDTIVLRSRQLAVRQIRWFRRDPRIAWFDPTGDPRAVVEEIDRHWTSVERAPERSEPARGRSDPATTVGAVEAGAPRVGRDGDAVLHLTKHHGLGNDFLVALAADNPELTPDPAVARALCDRRTGLGADGLLYGLAPSESDDDACMVLLNSDGSEAEISGNGIRCLGQALLRAEGQGEGTLRIETPGGVRTLRTVRGDTDAELWIQVDMGAPHPGPELGPASVEFAADRRATIDIGNPHLVLLVRDPDRIDLAAVGPALEADYEAGINVHAVAVEGRDRIRLRVWERGAGITMACGSGAVAATVAAQDWGLVDDRVHVSMPGGEAVVERADATMLLTGPSVFVAEVRVP